MAKIFIGIDPGAHGAVAILEDGELPVVADFGPLAAAMLQNIPVTLRPACLALMEAPAIRPMIRRKPGQPVGEEDGGQNPSTALALGRNAGIVEGWCQALGIPFDHDVSSASWKAKLGINHPTPRLPAGTPRAEKTRVKNAAKKERKAKALELARRLFPSLASSHLARAMDDGRAEALLIAEYLRRREGVRS